MDYYELTDGIKQYFPSNYPRHYRQSGTEDCMGNSLEIRKEIAEGLVEEIIFFVWYPRKIRRPQSYVKAMDQLADYILATDHLRGLARKRLADGQLQLDEDYPPLGQGAKDHFLRKLHGYRLTPKQQSRVKVCEICKSEFLDKSRAGNASVCAESCRRRKEARRKRKEYNAATRGLVGESRLKRDWTRQDLEYPFYSPYELDVVEERSESARESDEIEWLLYQQDDEYDDVRLNGRRKPTYVGRDEFDPERPFTYRPVGRERRGKAEEYPVVIRKYSDVKNEPKFVKAAKIQWKKPRYLGETCSMVGKGPDTTPDIFWAECTEKGA
ncbi:hypothetical protein K7T73_15930 [Bacillus badius]|uniref:hypothetical protein n=1 Tax=Bacillus badius TaxID=1455 RepID=UPI001CBFFBA4|nr:hypothetical protein [Bacillus badius]UAT30027.1 hypothetical protein K7T73_15930 [Bacillus badius]